MRHTTETPLRALAAEMLQEAGVYCESRDYANHMADKAITRELRQENKDRAFYHGMTAGALTKYAHKLLALIDKEG